MTLPKPIVVVALVALVAGCQPMQSDNLRNGYAALQDQNYDSALALAAQELRASPNGPAAAEAYYLRGRALEQRPAATPADSARKWAAARTAYEQALAFKPAPLLQAYIRASLGNVAFFQDDYATSAESFRLAYADLNTDDARAWALYRAALSYQRLGQFNTADNFFAETAKRYPGTLQAQRAAENRGARAFHIRLSAFSDEPRANSAADALRRQGFSGISILRDARGKYIVRLGPYASHPAAQSARRQLQQRFSDALIMP